MPYYRNHRRCVALTLQRTVGFPGARWTTRKSIYGPAGGFVVTINYLVQEVLMKRIITAGLLAVALFGVSACSSYPSWVPDWAQIGAEEKS